LPAMPSPVARNRVSKRTARLRGTKHRYGRL
jgi:hypothetical protein